LPPTLIVKRGVSFSRFLNVRKVVPSPPNVIARSSFIFFRSSNESILFVPATDTGAMVKT
jgi:hypothetical protein